MNLGQVLTFRVFFLLNVVIVEVNVCILGESKILTASHFLIGGISDWRLWTFDGRFFVFRIQWQFNGFEIV